MQIGFIGQGFIGKNYADEFENRGFDVVRYANEAPHTKNKDAIAACDIVFIAVPTPTTPDGFDDHIVRDVVAHTGPGATVVIKSTIVPGTTESIQAQYPDRYVLHSPEFLVEKSAATDAAHPKRNIVGIPHDSDEYRERAQQVLDILPEAMYEAIVAAKEAELIKYGGNCFLFSKVIFMNLMHDLCASLGCEFDEVKKAMAHDPRIGDSHMNPVHDSGRGAGGHCFIKDFAAFRTFFAEHVDDDKGLDLLTAFEEKNIELLRSTSKDLDLLEGVYGAKTDR
ncbi:MAG: NAD(P)-binding domain-containing protein [Candidatus Paceibacterota bacterium]